MAQQHLAQDLINFGKYGGLVDKQVPVVNLTESSITSQADLQDAFQSICLCSHGGEENTEDKNAE